MKKGFTLIELLAVIIILAIVALIATPIVLNVVEDAKDSTSKSQAYFLLDAAKNYHAESMFDDAKKENINNLNDIYGLIELSNKKPDNGKLYINSEGHTALSVIINKKCYKKELYGELEISKDERCDLGYIGNDTTPPSVDFDVLGDPFNSNGWSNKDFFVKITVVDNESGSLKYNWCSGIENCEPNVTQESSSGNALMSLNSDSNIVCVIGYDKAENQSEKTCSPLYKLDKVSPIFNGINDIFVNKNDIVDLTSGVNAIDDLSGIDGTYSYNPTSVDTTKAGTTEVTYSVSDMAGNVNIVTRKVIVDAIAPTVEYKALGNTINSNGWSKEDFFIEAILTDNSGLGIKTAKWCSTTNDTCEPTADMTNNKITPLINIESNNNRICIKATDNNDKTSEVMCSDSYKLDKTNPTSGTINISGTLGSNDWYTSNVSISASNGSDTLSGHDSSIVDITSITSNTTGTIVTLTTTDKAGNVTIINKTIKVDKNAPTVTATGSSITITEGDSNEVSGYFNVGYSISGGSLTCSPSNTSNLTAGNQTVSCTAIGDNGLINSANKEIIINIACNYSVNQKFEYTDTSTLQIKCTGNYKLEVWGQVGGSRLTAKGGNGGYSTGTKNVSSGQMLFIYVNYGGGRGYSAGNGGGATDIRLDNDTLGDRIIVAGGGGGAFYYVSTGSGGQKIWDGGYGGGLIGGSATSQCYCGKNWDFCNIPGGGGTPDKTPFGGLLGTLGQGRSADGPLFNAGGGGGYIGGGTGLSNEDGGCNAAGSGGSSYVGGVTNGITIAGNASMPSPTGSTEIGHNGNGYARITYLGP